MGHRKKQWHVPSEITYQDTNFKLLQRGPTAQTCRETLGNSSPLDSEGYYGSNGRIVVTVVTIRASWRAMEPSRSRLLVASPQLPHTHTRTET